MVAEQATTGVVVALREEYAAVTEALRSSALNAGRVRVLQGGLGGAMAAAAAHKLLRDAPGTRLLVSCGFSGGLADGLAVGDVFLATAVKARPSLEQAAQHDEPASCAGAIVERMAAAFSSAGMPCRKGVLVTLVQPVLGAADKRALGAAAAAQAVDMEAAAVARIARERQLDFIALRAISDAVDDELPPEVAAFLDEQGRVRAGQILKFAVRRPGNLKELWRLKSRSDRAGDSLQKAVRLALPIWTEALGHTT